MAGESLQARKFRGFWRDPLKKPWFRICYELLDVTLREGELPRHYFSRQLYRPERPNYRDYFGAKRVLRLHRRLNPPGPREVLLNKLLFYRFYEAHGLRVPETVAFTVHDVVVRGERREVLAGRVEFENLLRDLIAQSPSRAVFLKPFDGQCGDGCHKFTEDNCRDGSAVTDELFQEIIAGRFLIQNALVQHAEISAIYADSINTIRIDTYVHDDGHAEILSAFMRFGGGGSCIDNGCAGGCFVAIDRERPCLRAIGHRLVEFGGEALDAHPTTGVKFEGRTIPFMAEVEELARRAAEAFPRNRLVGWDIALLPDGPCLMEGNHNYHLGMQEIAFGGYRQHPTFAKIIAEHADPSDRAYRTRT